MEKFLALCICLPLLIVFVPQYGIQTVNNQMISQARVIVDAAKEEAKQEGCFTTAILDDMTDKLEELGYDGASITTDVTTTPKYRVNEYDDREMIEYDIGVPIERIIVANDFFGISDEDNATIYHFTGKVSSEKI